MAKWIAVGTAENYPEGCQVCTEAGEKHIVVFNVGGQLYAIRNLCPHAGLPLGEGERKGMMITCPFHGYTFNIKNGRNIDYPDIEPPVRTYPVRVEGGQVQVNLEPDT